MGRKKRVLVAMSGGIDSSLAACMLKRMGFEVIGATMKLWPKEQCGRNYRARACCSLNGIADAKHVAAMLDMPHHVFDFHNEFKNEVIDYFCNKYAEGLTPNPCVICNQKIKFSLLLKKAEGLGCEFMATGHYAKVGHRKATGRYFIREGKDKKKDQSYFLSFISQDALARTIFPLENMTKVGSRRLARDLRLRVHDKISSQEVCFVPGHYSDYIREEAGNNFAEGKILNTKGEEIGRHKGIHLYTIGQRKGLGIPYKEALYVINIDRKGNTVTVGTKKEVMKKVIIVKDLHWGPVRGISRPLRITAKIRYGHKKAKAIVGKTKDNRLKVTFEEPQEAPTPGQAAVFYKDDIVWGGGWIESASN